VTTRLYTFLKRLTIPFLRVLPVLSIIGYFWFLEARLQSECEKRSHRVALKIQKEIDAIFLENLEIVNAAFFPAETLQPETSPGTRRRIEAYRNKTPDGDRW